MRKLTSQNFLVFVIMFILVITIFPASVQGESGEGKKMSEQQKKELEKNLKQIEIERELTKDQGEKEHEQENDDEGRGLSILVGGTTGLILIGTIGSIMGVVGYAVYKIFSIRMAVQRKKKPSFEGMPK